MGAGPCAINDGYPHIYGGVCIDVGTFAPQLLPLGILMALIDLPFTLVGDTITLPWSITATIEHGRPPRATDAERKTWEERFRQNDAWEERINKPVEIEGIAHNLKIGAIVNSLWVDGLHAWPDNIQGKMVRVTGILIRRDDNPVFRPDPNELPKQGIPVPKGIDLERARRRYLIAQPHWEVIGE